MFHFKYYVMLPDFQNTKIQLRGLLTEYFEGEVEKHSGGMLKNIPKRVLHEGDGFIIQYEDGMQDETTLSAMHIKSEFKVSEIMKNPSEVFAKFSEMAKQQAMNELKLVTDKVSDITEKIGNVTQTRGEVTPNDIFEAFDKITIDFNPDGSAMMPTIWAGTEMSASLAKVFKAIDNDPELTKKFNQIMNNQRQKWHDRAANRKLVD